MKNRIFCILNVVALLLGATAVMNAQTPLPNDPEVKTGRLENGLTYYIRHNALPEGRCEFYLATNAGAIQETPDQDGLAHFLEHMCFNGLKNLPGKQMLDYLQHIGAEFGRNINASTGVEHTQYMLNNIPVIREGIIDTCLLVMHDYSHFVLNDPKEIDAERGVILEEKRTRNSAGWRMWEKSAKYTYGDCKYATCNIIGSEENLKNFKPESLVNFYRSWYQPDNQAIIVIGDIDVNQIYDKIVKLFADIPAPAKPTVKEMPEVPVNDKPVVGIVTDPENTSTSVEFIWKLGKPSPKQLKGTDAGYAESLIKRIVYSVMSERFNDIASKPDAPFNGATFGIMEFCETCEACAGNVECENAKVETACETFLTEVEKMKRFGFTDEEINRAKENILKNLKDKVAAKSTRKNPEFVRPIIRNFFDGTPYMDPEVELKVAQSMCTMLGANMINQIISGIFTGEHLTIIYEGIDKEGQTHPTEEQLLAIVDKVKASDIKANAAVAISTDFMAGTAVKAGKVKKEAEGLYGSTVWTLSNGLKVVFKHTEFKKDQVIFDLRKKGGKNMVATEDLASFDNSVITMFERNCGIADFPATMVPKMLTGKSIDINPYISNAYNGVSGSCSPEDFETSMQILHLLFVKPRFDQDEWNTAISQLSAVIPNLVNTPDYAFQKHAYAGLYGNNPRVNVISTETLEKANLETFAKYYKLMFKDIAGATLYITGNIDAETAKTLAAKYCGSLAKGKKGYEWNEANFTKYVKEGKCDVFKTKMTTPKASVFQAINNENVAYSIQKEVNLTAAEFILDMIFTETLREQEGGTYGASAIVDLSYEPYNTSIIQVFFDTNIQQQESLRKLALKGIYDLAANGPTDEQVTRAIENAKKNLPEKRITNSYWSNTLRKSAYLNCNADEEFEKAVNNITAAGIKEAFSEITSNGILSEVVMLPEE